MVTRLTSIVLEASRALPQRLFDGLSETQRRILVIAAAALALFVAAFLACRLFLSKGGMQDHQEDMGTVLSPKPKSSEKIQAFPDVQKLGSPAEESKATPKEEHMPDVEQKSPPKPRDTRLQEMLRAFQQYLATDNKGPETIATFGNMLEEFRQVLPTIEDSVLLSAQELATISALIHYTKSSIGKDLSPKLLTCLFRNSLILSDYSFIEEALRTWTFDPSLTKALMQAFEPHDQFDDDAKPVTTPTQKGSFREAFFLMFDFLSTFQQQVTRDELKSFALHLMQWMLENDQDDVKMVDFLHRLNLKNDPDLMKALCQGKNVFCLTQIYLYFDDPFTVTREIFASRANQKDPDQFFDAFLHEIVGFTRPDHLSIYRGFADYIFTHESDQRKQALFSILSLLDMIADLVDLIPTSMLAALDDVKMQNVAEHLRDEFARRPNPKKLQAFARAMNAVRLDTLAADWDNHNFVATLLPLTDQLTQIQFIDRMLDNLRADDYNRQFSLQRAKLNPIVWAAATKLNPSRLFRDDGYEPEYQAAMVNANVGNEAYLKSFFEEVFCDCIPEEGAKYVAHLQPEVFIFKDPENCDKGGWVKLFNALRDMPDQKKAKQLLISAALNLLNSPGFDLHGHEKAFNALSLDQIELLPLDQLTRQDVRQALEDRISSAKLSPALDD